MKPLPATYLEHLMAIDPSLLRIAKESATKLKEKGLSALSKGSDITLNNDAFAKLLKDKRESMILNTSKKHRIPLKELQTSAADGEFDDDINAVNIITAKQFITVTRHFMAGERIYHCGDGLVDRLIHTDVRVPVELLRLPFPHIMLVISTPGAIDRFAEEHGVKASKARPMSISVAAIEEDDGVVWQIDISQTKGKQMLASDVRTLRLLPGLTSEQIIRQDHSDAVSDISADEYKRIQSLIPTLRGPEDSTAFNMDHLWLYRLIVNLVLYITSAAPELAWPRRNGREHAGDRVNYSPREHAVVGESVARLIRYNGPAAPRVTSTGGGRALERQVIVGGHWKSQAHGPQRQLRRTIWIEPYERGPDIAAIVARPIMVK